jgi:hypothetical protein
MGVAMAPTTRAKRVASIMAGRFHAAHPRSFEDRTQLDT